MPVMTVSLDTGREPPPAQPDTMHTIPRLIGVAIWALAFAVIFAGSWRPAWSSDETATIMVARRSWSGVLGTYTFDAALEPYYIFAKVWSAPSTSHLWMRLPSVLAMSSAVLAIAVLATRWLGRRAGTLVACTALALPVTSRFGQEARPYAFSVLCVVLSVTCWQDPRFSTSQRRWWLFVLLVVLAGAFHPYSLLIIAVLVIASAFAPAADRRRKLSVTAACASLAVVILSPFLLVVARRASGQPNPPSLGIVNIAETVGRLPVVILSYPLAIPCGLVAITLALCGFVVGWRENGSRRRVVVVASIWLVLPPTVLTVLQASTGAPGLVTRYWLFSLPAVPVLAGMALTAVARRSGVAALACFAALVGLGIPSQILTRGVNGHLGQGWLDFPAVLTVPALRAAPLVTGSWNYHGLVGNDRAIARRIPLARDPDSSGRIIPRLAGPGSAQFDALIHTDRRVVVLATARSASVALPTAGSFGEFRAVLRTYPAAAVVCNWFGQPLGVFSTRGGALTATQRRSLDAQLQAIAPDHVRCATALRR